jgi:hypothetical protein
MTVHHLKCWPASYDEVVSNRKRFDIRVNDRDFRVGDTLSLERWDPDAQAYTGEHVRRVVTCIVQGEYGLPSNLCVMSLIDEGETQ